MIDYREKACSFRLSTDSGTSPGPGSTPWRGHQPMLVSQSRSVLWQTVPSIQDWETVLACTMSPLVNGVSYLPLRCCSSLGGSFFRLLKSCLWCLYPVASSSVNISSCVREAVSSFVFKPSGPPVFSWFRLLLCEFCVFPAQIPPNVHVYNGCGH